MIGAAENREHVECGTDELWSWIHRADTLVRAYERRERPLPGLAARVRRLRAERDEAVDAVRALDRRAGTGRAIARRRLSAARRHLTDSWRDVVSSVDARGSLVVSGAQPRAREGS